jgi:hypothetical protein
VRKLLGKQKLERPIGRWEDCIKIYEYIIDIVYENLTRIELAKDLVHLSAFYEQC